MLLLLLLLWTLCCVSVCVSVVMTLLWCCCTGPVVTCLDPGLSNCTTQIILVNINGDEVENINPTQQLGEWSLSQT